MDAVTTSGKTQRVRNELSTPMRELSKFLEWKDWKADFIHFGEGKAYLDTVELEKFGQVRPYDPNSASSLTRTFPTPRKTGVAIYVFNTLPPLKREQALWTFKNLCLESWFIAVRCDPIAGTLYEDGVITGIGTFQKSYSEKEALAEFGGKVIKKTRGYILLGGDR